MATSRFVLEAADGRKHDAGLTEIHIPHGVTYVGYRAFKGCKGLKSVTLPAHASRLLPGHRFVRMEGAAGVSFDNAEARRCPHILRRAVGK